MPASNVEVLTGELVKMTITPFDDEEYENPSSEDPLELMYNPTTYSREYANVFEEKEVEGSQKTLTYKQTESPTMTFEFLFDALGTSLSGSSNMARQIMADKRTDKVIDNFLQFAFMVQGDTHQPRYLRLQWGDFLFEGRAEKATVTHKLFDTNGYPLRSTVNCTFKTHKSLDQQAKETNKQSPDLTKQKLVGAEDTLPLVSFDEYQRPDYYLELARVNRINNFRRLASGRKLVLPPVDKTVVDGQ